MAKGKKTGGRDKGTPNKITEERRNRIKLVLTLLEETQEADIKALTAKDRVQLWNDLQEFQIPKLSRTEIKQDGPTEMVIRVIEEDGRDK